MPLSLSKARTAAIINQCATPGLGSLMARRYVVGIGQLLLAIAGFLLIIAWFKSLAIHLYALWNDGLTTPLDHRLGYRGALLFAAGWLWALITSLSVLRTAKRQESERHNRERPPIIEDFSPGADGDSASQTRRTNR